MTKISISALLVASSLALGLGLAACSSDSSDDGGSTAGAGGSGAAGESGAGGSTAGSGGSSAGAGGSSAGAGGSAAGAGGSAGGAAGAGGGGGGEAGAAGGTQTQSLNGCTDADFVDLTMGTDNDRMVMTPPGKNAYTPKCALIAKGQSVMFMSNFTSHPLMPGHAPSLTGESDGTQPSPIMMTKTGDQVTFAFPDAGDFPYYCMVHEASGMYGVVRVKLPAARRRGGLRSGEAPRLLPWGNRPGDRRLDEGLRALLRRVECRSRDPLSPPPP